MTRKLKFEDLENLNVCDCGIIFYEDVYSNENIDDLDCSSCMYRRIDN